MANDLAFYLREAALKLQHVELAFASDGSSYKYDSARWKVDGRSQWGGDILVPVDPSDPATAVADIFKHPERWQFDCSQFCQVVNYYAWLQLLKATKFNKKVTSTGGIRIMPFQGSVFTARVHYYRRERRTEWMKYYPNGDQKKPGQPSCMQAWEIVAAAPIGSRVNFTNDRAKQAHSVYENTVKVSANEFIAHTGDGGSNILRAKELITAIYQWGSEDYTADFAKADRHVWIKEVEFHVDVPNPIGCRR